MATFYDRLIAFSQKSKARIGVGILRPLPELLPALEEGKKYAEVVVIGTKIQGFDHVPAKDPKELAEKEAELLTSGKIDGLVRGQADSFGFRDALKARRGYDFSKIAEVSLIEDTEHRVFLMGPTSNPLGWTAASKVFHGEKMAEFIESFEVKPKVAVLTAVRPESVGRNAVVDVTWEQAEMAVAELNKKRIEAKNYNIEIETALDDGANAVVMPNGAAGNMVFRLCEFILCKGKLASLSLGIEETVCENSRNEQNFGRYIPIAVALVNRKRRFLK